ncbi:uncharacterized protein LOC142764875 isoform X2 [Rhipicephalus microplus]|uniref:uncharacterized protein LOC142764875 isoform X2 n=1 Tax=Rhipicephalus microplus TaxID=6941 RepID=UPI003F6AAD22
MEVVIIFHLFLNASTEVKGRQFDPEMLLYLSPGYKQLVRYTHNLWAFPAPLSIHRAVGDDLIAESSKCRAWSEVSSKKLLDAQTGKFSDFSGALKVDGEVGVFFVGYVNRLRMPQISIRSVAAIHNTLQALYRSIV